MDTSENDSNSNEGATGAQPTPAGASTGSVTASAQQLQQAISAFAQQVGGSQERFMALMQNPGGEPNGDTGGQTAPAAINASISREIAQQLQASISRFAQGNQMIHENLSRSMDRPSDQLWKLEREIADVRKETQRNRDLIRNYRSW